MMTVDELRAILVQRERAWEAWKAAAASLRGAEEIFEDEARTRSHEIKWAVESHRADGPMLSCEVNETRPHFHGDARLHDLPTEVLRRLTEIRLACEAWLRGEGEWPRPRPGYVAPPPPRIVVLTCTHGMEAAPILCPQCNPSGAAPLIQV